MVYMLMESHKIVGHIFCLYNLQVWLNRSSTEVNLDIMEDYEQVKNVFLTAMGDTPEQAAIAVVDSGKGVP